MVLPHDLFPYKISTYLYNDLDNEFYNASRALNDVKFYQNEHLK